MVASIRFWLRAFGVTENDKKTKLGDYLFDESKGKDKYLEDIATLWLLHFNLVFSEEATLYKMFFYIQEKYYPPPNSYISTYSK